MDEFLRYQHQRWQGDSHTFKRSPIIPPLNETTNIHLLIGRDAPELLKVWKFRNGPKETLWAQRPSLGWTVIGQMCLDLAGGLTHVLVLRISLLPVINSKRRIVNRSTTSSFRALTSYESRNRRQRLPNHSRGQRCQPILGRSEVTGNNGDKFTRTIMVTGRCHFPFAKQLESSGELVEWPNLYSMKKTPNGERLHRNEAGDPR